MKIRIKGDSIRYRLSKSDLEKFYHESYLSELTHFPNTELIYSLKANDSKEISADFQNNEICIIFPKSELDTWFNTEKVTYQHIQKFEGKELKILLEKDFVCIDNVEEDQSDNFPNPNLIC
jgi:hypothetical protein